MPYGKTLPYEYVCNECGIKMYGNRRPKTMAKTAIKKYCKNDKKVTEFKPKECKHSSN